MHPLIPALSILWISPADSGGTFYFDYAGIAMYKVLFADDEQNTIDSLSLILERSFPGQAEFFSATTVDKVLQICQLNMIEIAFVNIGMTGFNGLGEIKMLKKTNPEMLVIVLDGTGRPEYMRQAIKFGAFEYLTKPIHHKNVAETTENALAAIKINVRKKVSEIQIREKLDSVVNIVENDFIYSLIFPSDKTGDIEAYLDFFNIKEKTFYFMTIEIRDLSDANRACAYATVRDLISTSLTCIIGPLMRNRIVVFVPSEADDAGHSVSEALKGFAKLLHSRMTERLDLRIKIGLSGLENSWDRSLSAYNDSLKALGNADEKNGVIHSDECGEKNAETGFYPDELDKKLLDRAVAGDTQSVHALFSAISLWITDRYPDTISILKNKLFELLVLVRFQTRQVQPKFGGFAVWKDTWRQIESITEVAALDRYILSAVDECLSIINEHKQSRMSPLIIKACTIIHENLSQEISLEELSRRVEISPFYFSKLFKEETGENFIDYITMARMQMAKDLLRDQKRSIKEVSASSGYSDPNYFSKLFKKIMGLTPTEYRGSI